MREAIDAQTAEFKNSELAAAAEAMSRAYRSGLPARMDTPVARAAYLATRLPATYAALCAAADELPFEPDSWLDLGAGPAPSLFVAGCRLTLVEQNQAWPQLGEARRVAADLTRLPALEPHDVVSICYAMNEIAPRDRARLVAEAWSLARRAVLIVEPGTMEGFAIVAQARGLLIEAGASVHAPCPHNGGCPMEEGDWCHFAVRVERSRLHRQLKGGELSYEDEKYSYVLALKEDAAPAAARVLRHPRIQSGLIELRLCASEGIEERRVTKRDKAAWRAARHAEWGDRWEVTE